MEEYKIDCLQLKRLARHFRSDLFYAVIWLYVLRRIELFAVLMIVVHELRILHKILMMIKKIIEPFN